ncbi:MAG TPA: phosphatase PAP2 family protein [Firmicutes bacterium]|nr:phosphatase PAP2 family protein [Bacillota bacterium]
MKKILACIIIFFLAVFPVFSEKIIWERVFFDNFLMAGSAAADNPLQTALTCAGLAAAGIMLANNDLNLKKEFQKQDSAVMHEIFETANYFGDGIYVLAANSLFFLGGEKERKTAEKVIEALVLSNAFSYSLKWAAGRKRPSSTDDPGSFSPFSGNMSMPSGHATVAFSWAVIIGDRYDLGWLTYPLAALTALARVYKNAHWPSDVFAGAAIGTIGAKIINTETGDADISAGMDYNNNAFVLRYRF